MQHAEGSQYAGENEFFRAGIDDRQPLGLVLEGREAYYLAKRLFDVVTALVLLIILSPIMLLTMLSIYLYSPGPVFFTQQRVGSRRVKAGSRHHWKRVDFKCYKFRTMKINADTGIHKEYVQALIANDEKQMSAIQGEATQVRKLVNDPRIIQPGRILRKLSIDELPQLWNVLRGDMSLIGPRPAIPYEVEVYKPWHLRRLEAQPGLTGLQQVRERCTASFDRQVSLDIEYIERQSFWLDLKIAIKTPLAIVFGRGAY
jgi:lipopolysaccharide/colanic/teichoic acid biosynthesis glycosyltransferase